MKIYKQEIKDGLEDLLKSSSASIITSAITVDKPGKSISTGESLKNFHAVIEELLSQSDYDNFENISDDSLAFITSILVSTGWNLNDDIFLAEELIKAKDTPIHKPININHDESIIVGHMFATSILDKEGNEITDLSNASSFDIEVKGVLYKFLRYLKDDINEILEDARAGRIFVSMECAFPDFDYGLIDTETGETKIINRMQSTAHLTKYLRIYGGPGKFKGYKIGRILRDINFIGKGIVKEPANPDSVIKNVASVADDKNSGDYDTMDKELENIKNELDKAQKNLDTVKADLDKALKDLDEKSKELESVSQAKSDVEATLKTVESEFAKIKEQAAEFVRQVEESNRKYDEMLKRATEAENKLADIAKKEVAHNRLQALKEFKKIDDSNIDATIAELSEMTDDTFNLVLKYAKSEPSNTSSDTKTDKSTATASTDTTNIDKIVDNFVEEDGAVVNPGVNNDSEVDVAMATALCLLKRDSKVDKTN